MSTHDPATKLLGRILGEIYRIQNATEGMHCGAGPGQIYGLLNGFDEAIDTELDHTKGVSTDKLQAAAELLEPILQDPEKLEQFKGFYDVESALQARGISRTDAMQIFKYWWNDHRFVQLIEKMNSSRSPVECKTFELGEYEK